MKVVVEAYDIHNGIWNELFEVSAEFIQVYKQVLSIYVNGEPYFCIENENERSVGDWDYFLKEGQRVRWLNV